MKIDKIVKEYQTPFYLYDQSIIEDKINFLKNIKLNFKHKYYFAVKANPNLAIVNIFKQNNLGSAVVSSGELYKSLRAGIEPNNILFNGSSKNIFDLKYAVTQKIKSINIENIGELNIINDYSKEKNLIANVGIRINPNIDGGTLSKISTGKKGDKFGIELNQISFDHIKKFKNIKLTTLSVHIGSQITDYSKFIDSYKILIKLADDFNNNGFNINCLDFGGGFASLDKKELDFDLWSRDLNNIMNKKNYEIIFEPGRFLIGKSGIMATKVNYLKKTGNKNIVLLDSSFSEYIRPALYGIKPFIQKLNNNQNEPRELYDIAGGVCESSDFFIKEIELPKIDVGDFLIFKNVGAYGSSMSSTYNSRPRPLEILMKNEEHRVIRSRDSLEDLCKNEIM